MSTEEPKMAFPAPETDRNYFQSGMTLRDYFAAKAMQAILCPEVMRTDKAGDAMIAEAAYEIADAMLKARSK